MIWYALATAGVLLLAAAIDYRAALSAVSHKVAAPARTKSRLGST